MLRLTVFGTAVLLALAGRAVPASAEPSEDGIEEGGGGEGNPQAAPPAGDTDSGDAKSKPASRAKKQRSSRRSRHHGRFAGRVVPEGALRKDPLDPPSGKLVIGNQGKEEADVNIYNDDGSYNIESLRTLDHILRCRRTDAEKPIEPRLFTILSHVYDHFGEKKIEIVSGFRNQRKQTSNHFKGTASDIRISGVSAKKIEAFAETLDVGGMGIGIYPRSGFVHIDVRSPPSYRWTDYSPPNPNAPEKRPPRGWKRKKLQS
jgi:uncharacterized protein YcbK (DUF882 family)